MPPPTRVAYFSHRASPGGGELALMRLVPFVVGIEPLFISCEDGPMLEWASRQGIDTHHLRMRENHLGTNRNAPLWELIVMGLGARSSAMQLRRLLTEKRIDVLHANSLKAGLIGSLATMGHRTKLIWHLRDALVPAYFSPRSLMILRALLAIFPAMVVCNSHYTASTLPARARRKARVIYSPGASSPVPQPNEPKGESTSYTFCVVGGLTPRKRQDLVLKAFAAADPNHSRLLVAGDSIYGTPEFAVRLNDIAQAERVEDQVEFLGHVAAIGEVYRRSDCLIAFSNPPEPLGQTVVEALRYGCYVLVSEGGGPQEIVAGLDAPTVAPDDVAGLAAAMRACILQRPTLDADRVRKRLAAFEPETLAGKLSDLYREVCASGASGNSASRRSA